MAKTKTPFLSLGSRGTVGGVLTSQKSGGVTILRKTPVPTDPYTLAQAYQRWDYKDYAYLWTLLTNSQKQVYRTRASRYHITGFSLWMREHLKDLPDLAGRWHLDETSGATAYDSSRNTNHGTYFGTFPTDGPISLWRGFDDIDDRITIPLSATIGANFFKSYPWTLELFFSFPDFDHARDMFSGSVYNPRIVISIGGVLNYYAFVATVHTRLIWTPVNTISPATLHHLAIGTDGANYFLYIDAELRHNPAWVEIDGGATDFRFGWSGWGGRQFGGYQDQISLYTRLLAQSEITRHSERRYP